jgi:hypothetical protein
MIFWYLCAFIWFKNIEKTLLQMTSGFLQLESTTECPKNGVLTVHYGVEETTVNVRKMFTKIVLDLFADLAVLESGS